MYRRVFVLVPLSTPPDQIGPEAQRLLELHEAQNALQFLEERFDRRSGYPGSLDDQQAEGLLPQREKRALHHRICKVQNLPADINPAAFVLPDGSWHDVGDFGWRLQGEPAENERAMSRWAAHVSHLRATHPDCFALEYWVHS